MISVKWSVFSRLSGQLSVISVRQNPISDFMASVNRNGLRVVGGIGCYVSNHEMPLGAPTPPKGILFFATKSLDITIIILNRPNFVKQLLCEVIFL